MKVTYTLTESEIIKILSKYLEIEEDDIDISCREVEINPCTIRTCAEANVEVEKEVSAEELKFITR
jgi:septum formation topological specificity factor MinE